MSAWKNFFATRTGIITVGAVIGVLAPLLQKLGNPGNMGICVACFERDIAGGVGLHRAAIVPVYSARNHRLCPRGDAGCLCL